MPSRPSLSAGAGVVAALVLTAGAVTLLPGAAPEAAAEALMPYDDCDALLEHYRDELARTATPYGSGGGMRFGDFAAVAADSSASAELSASGPAAPTGTNLQEAGVDEPDSAKTSGDLLLTVARGRLHVLRAGATPELLGTLDLGEQAWGGELLVQGDRVLVLLSSGGGGFGPADLRLPGGGPGTTRAVLLDIADPAQPRRLEELVLDGRYLSARLSGGAVRLVTASSPRIEAVYPGAPHGKAQEQESLRKNVEAARSATLAQVLPRAVRRNGAGMVLSDGRAVDCGDVRYAPSTAGASTLLVTTLDLTRGLTARDSTGVTTDGDLVYASADRLYVATSRWGTTAPVVRDDTRPATSTATVENTTTTELHAFDTSSPTRTTYAGSGSVDGYVLGRWALSSYEGHLRVATTTSPPWDSERASSSSVTVLAETTDGLTETGRVEGLGPTEQIRAVRYFGDLATVVTFRQTDPLYVLNLADPTAPRVLGELKVPGFSTYLHPVGDGLLMGVGQDADAQGRITGMQVSLYDLRDLSHPVQVDRVPLGQGYSPVEQDSRAFSWDPERRQALLPFLGYRGYAQRTHAVAIGVTDDHRLVERGRLEVAMPEGVQRVLTGGATVYALGDSGIVAGDADTLERTGRVAYAAR